MQFDGFPAMKLRISKVFFFYLARKVWNALIVVSKCFTVTVGYIKI